MVAAHVPEEQPGRGQNGRGEQPEGPRRQKDELPFVEKAGRVFEEEFEHAVHVNQGLARLCMDVVGAV